MTFDPNMKADLVKRSPKSAHFANSVKSPAAGPTPYDDCVPVLSQPRATLECELGVLEEPRWMAGLWAVARDTDGNEVGWRDSRTNTLLTFDDARQLIEDRIRQLGLSAELVHAFPQTRGFFSGFAEEHQFWNLPFEQRMLRFK